MASLQSWFGGAAKKAKEVVSGVERQLNPFDGGATYGNPRPPQQQQKIQAQRQQAQNLINRATQIQQQVNNAARNPLGFAGGQAYNIAKSITPIQVRDIFDANTASDQAKRLAEGEARMYYDQQKAKGVARPQQNIGQAIAGNTARLANTGLAGIEGVAGLGKVGVISALGNDKQYKNAVAELNRTMDKSYNPTGGILGAGTVFKNRQEAGSGNVADQTKRFIGSGLGTATEILPMTRGYGAVNKAIQTAGSLPKVALANSLENAGYGFAGSIAQQLGDNGKIDPLKVAQDTAVGAGMGLAIPVGGVALKKVLGAGGEVIEKAAGIRTKTPGIDQPRNAGKYAEKPVVPGADIKKTGGTQRLLNQAEMDHYARTGNIPANADGKVNVIKPGQIDDVRGITPDRTYLVTLRDGLPIDSQAGPQAAIKGPINRKFVASVEPYVPTGESLARAEAQSRGGLFSPEAKAAQLKLLNGDKLSVNETNALYEAGIKKPKTPNDTGASFETAPKDPIVNQQTGETLNQAVKKLESNGWAKKDIDAYKDAVLGKKATKVAADELDNLNPTGGVMVDYNPKKRATMKLSKNITTLDKTSGVSPNETITIYRGAPKNQKSIAPGDFITTNKELARSYTGDGNVLEMKVPARDVLDDVRSPLGEEYLYRPSKAKVRPVSETNKLMQEGKLKAKVGNDTGESFQIAPRAKVKVKDAITTEQGPVSQKEIQRLMKESADGFNVTKVSPLDEYKEAKAYMDSGYKTRPNDPNADYYAKIVQDFEAKPTPTKHLPIVGEPQVRAETPQATPDEIKISTTPQTNVKLNTKRLDIAPEEAAQIQAQTSEVVDRLSNKEVQDLATNAGIDTRSYSPEQTKKKIAEQLNLRNETAMIANKAKEARLAGDTDEAARLIREAAERGGIARSQGTDLARQLQARRIIADELATPEQRLFKLLDNAGVNPEVYSKRLATVDFDNANEVIKAYRDLVPATAGDWIDVVRYNSMLSSPLTQIVNVSSTAGNISLAPVERGITGTLDHLRSAITGGERTVASGEGRAYAGGMVKGVKQGLKDFKDTLQGLDENLNADVGQGGFVPVKAYGDSATHDILSFPGRLLGAFDNFHRAIVSSGSDAALSKRTAAGLKVGNIAAENAEEAAYRTFNGEIGKADQGYILRGIDEMTGLVMKARASKNPVVKWPAKLTLPFVRIGSNLLKQGIEYGPGGLATIPGAANKQAQLAKSIMGTAVFGAAGSLIGRNRLTWAEPTNADQKKAFKEAGMQPYSVKIGNNWVGFAKLPPIISFNFALAAALDDAVKTAKLNENGLDNVMGAVAKYGNFLADQSYVKNVGDLLAAVKGDAESVTRLVGNYPQQFIPERAFTGWLAKMSDSTQRMINTDASFADKQVETLFQQYPFLRQKTTARTDTAGNPLASQHPLLNAFSPTPVSTENAEGKLGYDVLQQRLGANRDKTALKKSGVLTEGQQKSADKKVKETEIKKTLSPAERQLYDYSNADLEAMNSESAKKVLALKGTTSSTASTDPKSKYTAAQKKYDEDKKAGKISDVKDMAEQSKLTRLRAQSAYSQDTVDLYSQSFKNIISFVNSNKNGAKLWEEVKSLDKKMTDAGYTSKLYNKNGSLKATVSKSGKKSAKAKKGKVVKLPKFNITGKAVSYKKVGAPKAKLPVSKLPKIKINKLIA